MLSRFLASLNTLGLSASLNDVYPTVGAVTSVGIGLGVGCSGFGGSSFNVSSLGLSGNGFSGVRCRFGLKGIVGIFFSSADLPNKLKAGPYPFPLLFAVAISWSTFILSTLEIGRCEL